MNFNEENLYVTRELIIDTFVAIPVADPKSLDGDEINSNVKLIGIRLFSKSYTFIVKGKIEEISNLFQLWLYMCYYDLTKYSMRYPSVEVRVDFYDKRAAWKLEDSIHYYRCERDANSDLSICTYNPKYCNLWPNASKISSKNVKKIVDIIKRRTINHYTFKD